MSILFLLKSSLSRKFTLNFPAEFREGGGGVDKVLKCAIIYNSSKYEQKYVQ